LISAVISQYSTSAGLLKNGAGTLRLTGNNTYAGETYLGSGTLQVDGAQPQSPVTLDHDTRLQGSGTVGHILLNGGATTIAPGTSPGMLTCSNLIASGGNGILQIELNGTTPGTAHDQLNVRGTVDLLGLKLSGTLGFASAVGNQFRIINNDGADAVTGTFTGLPQGAELYIGSERFQISYTGGTGNDVVLARLVTAPLFLHLEPISTTKIRLYWSTNYPDFHLEYNTSLNSTNWAVSALTPVVMGTNLVVTNSLFGAQKFYRLSRVPSPFTPPPPTLAIQRASAGNLRLLWPAEDDRTFTLQSNTNLTTTNWVTVSPASVILGWDNAVTNAISGAQKYYRLLKP
jgi:autotransporter-associated beta strand protein